jgi:hypothetical protein
VHQKIARREEIAQRLSRIPGRQPDRVKNPARRVRRDGRRLEHAHRPVVVFDDQIREGAPGIADDLHAIRASASQVLTDPVLTFQN